MTFVLCRDSGGGIDARKRSLSGCLGEEGKEWVCFWDGIAAMVGVCAIELSLLVKILPQTSSSHPFELSITVSALT